MEEIARVVSEAQEVNGEGSVDSGNGDAKEYDGSGEHSEHGVPMLNSLVRERRAGSLKHRRQFWVAAERLPLIQSAYPNVEVEPSLTAPEPELGKKWERSDAVRELVRGRMEISGPVTSRALAELLDLPSRETDTALLDLEAEGFVLRGKFHAGISEVEWCDRRLLARIHRLTIHRLRAEIQPVSIAEFQRFLLAWQRAGNGHRVEGPSGLQAVLEILDGYELPAAAWEPDVLALRVKDYSPSWLDQLCFTGRVGWGRLTIPQNRNGRPAVPVRSSPVSFFARANLTDWIELSPHTPPIEYCPDTMQVFEALIRDGALFFGALVRQTGLLPSRVEQALAELVAQGWVTADSFEGLRALLVPQEKRLPFADLQRKRHHKAITSVEYAGRRTLLRPLVHDGSGGRSFPSGAALHAAGIRVDSDAVKSLGLAGDRNFHSADARETAIETFARALLRRYGLIFRRLLERESLKATWYELGRVYRRLEARGEIRGGHFVSGVSGEQFALPEAIRLLRSIRKAPLRDELIAISGADPLNLAGILTPGPRVAAIAAHRILLSDGVPIASLEAGEIIILNGAPAMLDRVIERELRVGNMPPLLRPYYA